MQGTVSLRRAKCHKGLPVEMESGQLVVEPLLRGRIGLPYDGTNPLQGSAMTWWNSGEILVDGLPRCFHLGPPFWLVLNAAASSSACQTAAAGGQALTKRRSSTL